jgi:hypothetical protein
MEASDPPVRPGLRFWRGHRKLAFFGFVLVGTALAGWWLLPMYFFEYRFGAVLPAGVSGATNVTRSSRPPPADED